MNCSCWHCVMWQFVGEQLHKFWKSYGNLHLLAWKINTSSITLWKTSRATRIKCFRADMSNLKQTRFVFAIYCVNVKKHALEVGCPSSFFFCVWSVCARFADRSYTAFKFFFFFFRFQFESAFTALTLMTFLSRSQQRCCQTRKSRTDIKIIFSGRLFLSIRRHV